MLMDSRYPIDPLEVYRIRQEMAEAFLIETWNWIRSLWCF